MFADSYSIVAGRRKYFTRQLDVHGVNDNKNTDIHTAEPLVSEPVAFEVQSAIEKIKSHKSPVLIKSQQN